MSGEVAPGRLELGAGVVEKLLVAVGAGDAALLVDGVEKGAAGTVLTAGAVDGTAGLGSGRTRT